MALLHQIEAVFQLAVQYGVLLLECAGVAVLLVTAVKSMIGCVKHRPHIRLYLAQGISLALEFKLGGEVLRTVLVREMSELLTLGLVILLRGALTLIIHWEIKTEEARMDEAAGHENPALTEAGRTL